MPSAHRNGRSCGGRRCHSRPRPFRLGPRCRLEMGNPSRLPAPGDSYVVPPSLVAPSVAPLPPVLASSTPAPPLAVPPLSALVPPDGFTEPSVPPVPVTPPLLPSLSPLACASSLPASVV